MITIIQATHQELEYEEKTEKKASPPRMLFHTAKEKDTRGNLTAAMMAQNSTRKLRHSEIDVNYKEENSEENIMFTKHIIMTHESNRLPISKYSKACSMQYANRIGVQT